MHVYIIYTHIYAYVGVYNMHTNNNTCRSSSHDNGHNSGVSYTVRRKGLLKLKDKGCLVCHGGQPF